VRAVLLGVVALAGGVLLGLIVAVSIVAAFR
jgi:hypothetical protein